MEEAFLMITTEQRTLAADRGVSKFKLFYGLGLGKGPYFIAFPNLKDALINNVVVRMQAHLNQAVEMEICAEVSRILSHCPADTIGQYLIQIPDGEVCLRPSPLHILHSGMPHHTSEDKVHVDHEDLTH
ncbi:hypothetical protein EV424DRAFT_1347997 [Suillus variegatus]|nr:hypothetical protein EV424DRAFT_1347997 [Suillus variegatus]